MDGNSLNQLTTKLDTIDQSIPPWALLLIETMKGVITELQNFNELNKRVVTLEDKNAVAETITTNLSNENSRLNDLVVKLEARIDDQEQRNRNVCLLIHGIQEEPKA